IIFFNSSGEYVARVDVVKSHQFREIKINIDEIFKFAQNRYLLFFIVKNGKPILRYSTFDIP
ncbi:MAG: hypothetical protein ABIJ45_09015, partial [Candidatus Zixiibacteriota bacterium]